MTHSASGEPGRTGEPREEGRGAAPAGDGWFGAGGAGVSGVAAAGGGVSGLSGGPAGSGGPGVSGVPAMGTGVPPAGTGAPGAPGVDSGAAVGTGSLPRPDATAPSAGATRPLPFVEGPPPRPSHRTPGPAGRERASRAPADGTPAPAKPGRDRYLDLLRSIALVRVVVYHLFGWAWLSILFPSMGVMFALAGSLMARSLSRPALGVIRGRVRRLLPPMWLFGGLVMVLLLLQHWDPAEEEGTWGWIKVLNYLVPLGAPPYPDEISSPGGLFDSTWADQAAGPLWYIRAYLWFVIATPLLLRAFRRFPSATVAAPMVIAAVITTGLVDIPGETGLALADFMTYGSCWMLGVAHQEGVLQKVPRYLAVSCASMIMVFGIWWAHGHLTEDGWDLNDIPLAQATWSFGFVVILLQYSPSWRELPRRLKPFDKLITLSNNRAVTIYLWHNALIMLTVPLIDLAWNLPFMDERWSNALDKTYTLWMFVLVWPMIAVAIAALGWVEDLAAKRGPRLWPGSHGGVSRR